MAHRYLIDVRTPAEFAIRALTGAINVEYQHIARFVAHEKKVPKDAEIILYCRTGRRSAIAKVDLDALGYKRVQDLGGFEAAREALKRLRCDQANATASKAQNSPTKEAYQLKPTKSMDAALAALKRSR
ncbi:uncharacterized protein PV09_04131 [Verruconis gallopava]|uniref:Rhodanese domain-containing protein n=1 Tax=Verruconis gallopava TaxID=253628 RepID=A0A0D2B0W7_9PEZI|nr:uncharacterized protein PV09_04131 [Verruconis gallopava]KIW04969.1 hypothetical protein PV09_04131 [Verruconis gallopava]